MASASCNIFLLVSAYFVSADFIEKTTDNYEEDATHVLKYIPSHILVVDCCKGPYTLEMEQLYPCRGPKLTNLTTYTTTLVNETIFYKGAVNMTFLDQTRIEDVKMSVYTMKDNQKILLWHYMVNKPCQHYAMSKVFETYVKAQNCVVKKGTYTCLLNLTEVTQSYLGTSFFYGEFIFKVIVLSKKGNIICLVFNPTFKKKV